MLERETYNVLKEVGNGMLVTNMDNIEKEVNECSEMVEKVYAKWRSVLESTQSNNLIQASCTLKYMKENMDFYTTKSMVMSNARLRMFDDIWTKMAA